jgi:hypothetical protein
VEIHNSNLFSKKVPLNVHPMEKGLFPPVYDTDEKGFFPYE